MVCKSCIFLVALLLHFQESKSISIDLFEHLVPTSKGVKNEVCKNHSEFYLSELKNGALWAWKMFDSSSKLPSGVLHGSTSDFGNFDECIQVRTQLKNVKIFGKYCLPAIEMLEDNFSNDTVKDNTEVWRYIKAFSEDYQKRPRNKFRWGVCIPSSCNEDDLVNHLQHTIDKYSAISNVKFQISIPPNSCQTGEPLEYDLLDYIFLCIVFTIIAAVLASTVYEMKYYVPKPQTTLQAIARCFSIPSNYRKLVAHYEDVDNLECIHGMRVMSTFVTVAFHILLTILQAPILNLPEVEGWYKSSFARTILNLHSMIDIFFILTAFLTTFMLLDDLYKNRPFNYVRFVVHRLVRCTPLYVLTVFLYSSIYIKLGNGPLWKEMITVEKENCKNNWWASLLYINNYVNSDKICVIQSWFLSASMQMFVVTPPLVILLYKKPKIGIATIVGLMFLSTGFSFLQVYYSNLEPIILFTTNVLRDIGSDTFRYGYIPTHTRFSAYLMGILTAYWRYKIKRKEMVFPKFLIPYGWYVSTSCMIITLYFGNIYYLRRAYNQLESATFATVYHILVGYTMCWTIVAMSTGHGKFMEPVFARKSLIPYSKITYSVNMCNFSLLYYITTSLRVPIYMSKAYLMWHLVITIVVTYAVGLVLYLFFEAPFIYLDKLFFFNAKPKATETNDDKKTINKVE